MSINHVTLTGNITNEPTLTKVSGGYSLMKFGVAVNDRRKNPQTKEYQDYPNYVDCFMFGSRADKMINYIKKGQRVAVEGKLRWSRWEKDGVTHTKLEVDAREIVPMALHQSSQSEQVDEPTTAPAAEEPTFEQYPDDIVPEQVYDDLPF